MVAIVVVLFLVVIIIITEFYLNKQNLFFSELPSSQYNSLVIHHFQQLLDFCRLLVGWHLAIIPLLKHGNGEEKIEILG